MMPLGINNEVLLIKNGYRDGEYQQSGVEHGPTVLHHGEVKAGRVAVFKQKGYHYWSSRGQQDYAGAEFHIVEVDKIEKPRGTYERVRGRLIYSFPVKSDIKKD